MERSDLGDFNRGVDAINREIYRTLKDSHVKGDPTVSSVLQGSARVPDSITFEVIANGRRSKETFTKNEVLDAGTGVDQPAVTSRIRGMV